MSEVDYCLLCQERDKDSCSKGFRARRTRRAFKPNPLGVPLAGLPARGEDRRGPRRRGAGRSDRRARDRHRRQPDVPGHRPPHLQRLHEGLRLPEAGAGEHPAGRDRRPHRRARSAVGLRDLRLAHALEPAPPDAPAPAAVHRARTCSSSGSGRPGYTLAQHLLREGVRRRRHRRPQDRAAARATLVGRDGHGVRADPRLARLLRASSTSASGLGFGGVSEYGITIRWDKNFLTVIAATLMRWQTLKRLRRHPLRRHARSRRRLAARHRPRRDLRGRGQADARRHPERHDPRHPAGLRLPHGAAAHRRLPASRSLANLQVRLPAVVIGGGLTAIDTATELSAYYLVQCEKTLERFETLAG